MPCENQPCSWETVEIPVTRREYQELKTRKMRMLSFLDKSEAAIIGVKIVAGAQLSIDPPPLYLNPISHLLKQAFPGVPLWVHGAVLILLALLHIWAVTRNSYRWRKNCIAAGLLLFLYIGWAAIVSGVVVPGTLLIVLYTLFGWANYASLMRPPTE